MERIVKLAVVGSRGFDSQQDYLKLQKELDKYEIDYIISGGAKGCDSLAYDYAEDNAIPILVIFPDFKNLGRKAGPIRNKIIIDKSSKVIAFWDKSSKGTKNSIEEAKKQGKLLKIVYI